MNLRLTQSKWGSTLDRSCDHLLLNAFHLRGAFPCFVVEPGQMKQAMNQIEPQLVAERGAELPRLAFRRLGADQDLAVIESNHVSRRWIVHELPMDLRDPFVGDQHDADLGQIRQRAQSPLLKL